MNLEPKKLVRVCLPRTVRAHRILSGPLRGERIVTSWHDYLAAVLGGTERALLGWFAGNVKAGETWFDIGAHYGYTAIALCRHVGLRGRVFAFEPILGTAGQLAETRATNGLHHLTVMPYEIAMPADIEVRQLTITRGMANQTIARTNRKETLIVAGLDWLWPRFAERYSRSMARKSMFREWK